MALSVATPLPAPLTKDTANGEAPRVEARAPLATPPPTPAAANNDVPKANLNHSTSPSRINSRRSFCISCQYSFLAKASSV